MIGLALAAALSTAAATPFPVRSGLCGWVHGTFQIANGSSIQRIWIVGTRHVVALYDADCHYPRALRRLVYSKKYKPFETAISGEFLVCARENWIPGHLQHVGLKSARQLTMF
jgi:hypothetical protein